MPTYQTIDPYNGEPIRSYEEMNGLQLENALKLAEQGAKIQAQTPLPDRLQVIKSLGDLLLEEAPRLALLATEEMGKPLAQATSEVKKCAACCSYYYAEASTMLSPQEVVTDPGVKSYLAYRPLGTIFGVMPWNFPYWQVIRFAVPALAAGNAVLLKHAENTTAVALELESLMRRAGFDHGQFQTLLIGHDQVKAVIASPVVKAVSVTGSERAGQEVASEAGRHLKKCVLELGGSDAYLVLRDADIEEAALVATEARLVNNGQSCVAAKRFIVEDPVYDQFVEAFAAALRKKVVGDPKDAKSDVGPLAKAKIREDVAKQTQVSVTKGARVVLGGTKPGGPGFFYPPTLLKDVTPGMPAFDEEVFGPVAAVIRAKNEHEALNLANLSRYGLGGAIFSRDLERAEALARDRLEAGMVVVNGQVVSDPRLPFGGVKLSGYGRELSELGLREFVNIKTVTVKAHR